MVMFTYLFGALAALFSIINPLSAMPVFLGLTANYTNRQRIFLARKAAFFMALILLGFLVLGSFILRFFGISLDGIRIAGGLVIVRSGYALLNAIEKPNLSKESKKEGLQKADISLTPLAMPLLAGPGAIAVVISMSANVDFDHFYQYFIIGAAILIVAGSVYLAFRLSPKLIPLFGTSGIEALTKIMGFITMCIGVQFFINGLKPILMEIMHG